MLGDEYQYPEWSTTLGWVRIIFTLSERLDILINNAIEYLTGFNSFFCNVYSNLYDLQVQKNTRKFQTGKIGIFRLKLNLILIFVFRN